MSAVEERIFCTCIVCGTDAELPRIPGGFARAPVGWIAFFAQHWPPGIDMGPLVLRLCVSCLEPAQTQQEIDGVKPDFCPACQAIAEGRSGFCRAHAKAGIAEADEGSQMGKLVVTMAKKLGIIPVRRVEVKP